MGILNLVHDLKNGQQIYNSKARLDRSTKKLCIEPIYMVPKLAIFRPKYQIIWHFLTQFESFKVKKD